MCDEPVRHRLRSNFFGTQYIIAGTFGTQYVIYNTYVTYNIVFGTSTIMIPTGDQDPMVHLTQSFWMAVAPPILVANHI